MTLYFIVEFLLFHFLGNNGKVYSLSLSLSSLLSYSAQSQKENLLLLYEGKGQQKRRNNKSHKEIYIFIVFFLFLQRIKFIFELLPLIYVFWSLSVPFQAFSLSFLFRFERFFSSISFVRGLGVPLNSLVD